MKLKPSDVRAIRFDFSNGMSEAQLAAKYDIHQGGAIWNIIHGLTYRRAGGPVVPPPKFWGSRDALAGGAQ